MYLFAVHCVQYYLFFFCSIAMGFPWWEEIVEFIVKLPVKMEASSWVSRSHCFFQASIGVPPLNCEHERGLWVCLSHGLSAWIGTKMSLLSTPLSKQWKDMQAIYRLPSVNNWGVHLFIRCPTCYTKGMMKIAQLHLDVIVLITDKLPMTRIVFHRPPFVWYVSSQP